MDYPSTLDMSPGEMDAIMAAHLDLVNQQPVKATVLNRPRKGKTKA